MSDNCTIRGFLYGRLCDDLPFYDRIAGATVYAVPGQKDPLGGLNSLTTRNLKPQIRSITAEELKERTEQAGRPLTGRTDNSGIFCLDGQEYDGQALDVYTCVDAVPQTGEDPQSVALPAPRCFFLGTYQPIQFGDCWYLVLVLPVNVWCELKRLADVWSIVGRVTVCDEEDPLGGVRVFACDTDIVQDDPLGNALTNSEGYFRIDYLGSTFRQGTIIDVELFGGPDVYFRIETSDGSETLLQEPRSRGRSAGRANVGPCFCVELCAPLGDDDAPPADVTAWTGIGSAFSIPDAGNLNSFDADGYAGAAKFALTGTIRMTGSIAYTPPGATPPGSGFVSVAGHPIRYRFLVSETPTTNTLPATPAGSFSRIVGAGPAEDIALFQSVKVGEMVRTSPFKKIDIRATLDEVDSEGWLDLNRSILRVFLNPAEQNLGPGEMPLTPADLGDFKFQWVNGALMGINTNGLTTEPNVPGPITPGQAVPAGDRIGVERFAFRFEVRAFDDVANVSFPMPGNGTQLDAAVINNNPEVRAVAMQEHLAIGSCQPLSGDVHVAYTVHHPHLRNVSLTVRSNDFNPAQPNAAGSYNANLSDPPLPLTGNTNAAITHLNNGSLLVPAMDGDGTALKRCTYLVTLNVRLRLHTGDSEDSNSISQTTFFLDI